MAIIAKKDYSSSGKNKILIIVCALAIASYFGLRYPVLSKRVDFQENMINRRLNRMETRLKAPPEPKASPVALQNQLDALDAELLETRQRLSQLSGKFVPLNSMEAMQSLRLEISRLAEDNRLTVVSMSGFIDGRSAADGAGTSAEVLEQMANNRFGRPLMSLLASGGFGGVMRFLEQLDSLSHNVSVVRLHLAVMEAPPSGSANAARAGQLLRLDVLLAL